MSNDDLARRLQIGSARQLRTQPRHLKPITQVDDGIIIINERAAKVSTDEGLEITTNGTHLVTFLSSATVNGTKYVNQRETLTRSPGVAGSPLLNSISYDPVLSMPQLQRMNNHNLRVIQNFEDEFKAAGSHKIWIAAGIILSVVGIGFLIVWKIVRGKQASKDVQKAINSYKITENG